MSEDRAARQMELLAPYVAEADALITTAAVPGRQAPLLVTSAMVEQMKPGSVVVDLAAESGGNVEGAVAGEVVRIGNAQVWGGRNVPSQMPGPASKLYAQNLVNILTLMTTTGEDDAGQKVGSFTPDFEDEIVAGSCVTHDGEVRHEATRERQLLWRPSMSEGVVWLTIFILSVFVGIEVISKVSSTLHTPLMSGANAIHGVILLGAILVTGSTDNNVAHRGRAGRDRARRDQHGRRLRGDRPDAADVRAQEARAAKTAGGRRVIPVWAQLLYLLGAVCFILALKGLSGPKTARAGNLIGAAAAVMAVRAARSSTLDLENIPLILARSRSARPAASTAPAGCR